METPFSWIDNPPSVKTFNWLPAVNFPAASRSAGCLICSGVTVLPRSKSTIQLYIDYSRMSQPSAVTRVDCAGVESLSTYHKFVKNALQFSPGREMDVKLTNSKRLTW